MHGATIKKNKLLQFTLLTKPPNKSSELKNGQQTYGSRHLQQWQDGWYHPPSWPLHMNLAARSEKLRQYKPNGSTPLISKSVSEHRQLHPPSDITTPSFNTHLNAILLHGLPNGRFPKFCMSMYFWALLLRNMTKPSQSPVLHYPSWAVLIPKISFSILCTPKHLFGYLFVK